MSWKINIQGGSYCHGSAHSQQKRLDIIVSFINTQSIAATSINCKVSYNSVSKIVGLFQQKATLLTQVHSNSRPKVIPWWLEQYIEAILVFYPTSYIREVQTMVADDFNLATNDIPSCSFISQLLKWRYITRKKCAIVAVERFIPFLEVYFFDETSFATDTDERKYGRSESGYPVPCYRKKSPTACSNSVLSVVGYREGVIVAIPVEGNFNIPLINDVITNQILPLIPHNAYLVSDNASVHRRFELSNILSQRNITLVMLPAYSYDLNPIEQVFGLAKCMARQTPASLEENILLSIINAFIKIRTSAVRNFYRRSWRIFV